MVQQSGDNMTKTNEKPENPKREFYYFIKPESSTKDIISRVEYLTFVLRKMQLACKDIRAEDMKVVNFGGSERIRLLLKYYNLHQSSYN